MKHAAESLTEVVLELGGKDPLVLITSLFPELCQQLRLPYMV